MQGIVVNFVAVGEFHDHPEVHHSDAVADVAHHGKVVCDEEIGEAEVALQVFQQVNICAWMETSRAEIGSSQTMKDGFIARARATPMR